MKKQLTRHLPAWAIALGLFAHGATAQSLQEKYEKKVSQPWFTDAGWTDDFDAAKARAKKEGKLVFAYFTRSYSPWPPCIALENGLFSTDEFQSWGKKEVVLFASIMTRIEGREHDALLRDYGFRGFPSMAILDAGGEALTKKVSRDLYGMKTAVFAVGLQAKVDAGTASPAETFMAKIAGGSVELDADRASIGKLKLSKEDKARAENILNTHEIVSFLGKARGRNAGMSPQEAQAGVYKFFKRGLRLPEGHSYGAMFNDMLVTAAAAKKDSKAFMSAYPTVKKFRAEQVKLWEQRAADPRFKNNERTKNIIAQRLGMAKDQLTKLEKDKAELSK